MADFDVVIIGAGPIGLACGIEAEKAGLTYTIIDKGSLVNSIYNYPTNMTFFSTSDRLEIGGVPFISHNPKPTRREALEYYRRVASSWKLNTKLYEPVNNVKKESNWDRAAQRPCVTALALIFPERKEFVPPGFSVVRKFNALPKSGDRSPANLNFGGEPVYLCFRRSREGNPIMAM